MKIGILGWEFRAVAPAVLLLLLVQGASARWNDEDWYEDKTVAYYTPCQEGYFATFTGKGYQMLGYVNKECQQVKHVLEAVSSWKFPSNVAEVIDEAGKKLVIKSCSKGTAHMRTVAVTDTKVILDPVISSTASTDFECYKLACVSNEAQCNGNEEFCKKKTCDPKLDGFCFFLKKEIVVSGEKLGSTLHMGVFQVSLCQEEEEKEDYKIDISTDSLDVSGPWPALIQVLLTNSCVNFNHSSAESHIPMDLAMKIAHRFTLKISSGSGMVEREILKDSQDVCAHSEFWSHEGLRNFHCHGAWSIYLALATTLLSVVLGLATFLMARKLIMRKLTRTRPIRVVETEGSHIEMKPLVYRPATGLLVMCLLMFTVVSACSDLTASQGWCDGKICTGSTVVTSLIHSENCFSLETSSGATNVRITVRDMILIPKLTLKYYHVEAEVSVSSYHNCFGSGLCTGSFCAENDRTRHLNTVTGKNMEGLGISGCFKSCASGLWCGCLLPITSCLFWSAEFTNPKASKVWEVSSWDRHVEMGVTTDKLLGFDVLKEGENHPFSDQISLKVMRMDKESFHLPTYLIESPSGWRWSDKISPVGAPQSNMVGSIQCKSEEISNRNCVFSEKSLTCNPHIEEVRCSHEFPGIDLLSEMLPHQWDDLTLTTLQSGVGVIMSGQRTIQYEMRLSNLTLVPRLESTTNVTSLILGGCFNCNSGGFLTINTSDDSGMVTFTSGSLKGLVVHINGKNTTVSHHWEKQHFNEMIQWASGTMTGRTLLTGSLAFLPPIIATGNSTKIGGNGASEGDWISSVGSWIQMNFGLFSLTSILPYAITVILGVFLAKLFL
jgi:hypothetical protein